MTEDSLPAPSSPKDCEVIRAAVEELNHGLPWAKYVGPREGMERPTPVRMFHLAAALLRWRRDHAPEIPADPLIEFREKLRHGEEFTKAQYGIVAATLTEFRDFLAKKKRGRTAVAEANKEAMSLAKRLGQEFFLLSGNKQAALIGCSPVTWRKTLFFKSAQKRRAKLVGPGKRKGPGSSPPTASLTSKLEAAAVEGNKGQVLEQLIAEQEADHEMSPLDDDPPDRAPRKVRARKRL